MNNNLFGIQLTILGIQIMLLTMHICSCIFLTRITEKLSDIKVLLSSKLSSIDYKLNKETKDERNTSEDTN